MDEVHGAAEDRALGALEERAVHSRYCAGARPKEQERGLPRIGFEWRYYPGGAVRVPEIKVYPLSEAAAAHRVSEGRHLRGKLVFKVR
jgi:NADPH:quinone reductase-like Zn-dependent oxidoreductase